MVSFRPASQLRIGWGKPNDNSREPKREVQSNPSGLTRSARYPVIGTHKQLTNFKSFKCFVLSCKPCKLHFQPFRCKKCLRWLPQGVGTRYSVLLQTWLAELDTGQRKETLTNATNQVSKRLFVNVKILKFKLVTHMYIKKQSMKECKQEVNKLKEATKLRISAFKTSGNSRKRTKTTASDSLPLLTPLNKDLLHNNERIALQEYNQCKRARLRRQVLGSNLVYPELTPKARQQAVPYRGNTQSREPSEWFRTIWWESDDRKRKGFLKCRV